MLTWNALQKTEICIHGLLQYPMPDVVIKVVDNASVDGTLDYLRKLSAQGKIDLIENKKNLGYSKAVNIGIRNADPTSDIVLLNNDIEILHADWLDSLREAAFTRDDIGICGARILRADRTIQHCGAYMPFETMWGQQIAGGETDINQYAGVTEVESVVFACAYIKRKVIHQVGLLSEEFFAYFEDSDYCIRARLAGFKVAMAGDVKLLHHENTSTKANNVDFNKLFNESRDTFSRKWKTKIEEQRYKYKLDWHSIVNIPTGYATSSKEILLALENDAIINGHGVKCAYRYVYGKDSPFPVDEPEHTDSYMLNCIKQRPFETSDVQVVYAQGDVFAKNSGKYKIGFTMLETSGIPKDWVRQANMMDEIWVPSSFNERTFVESGVTKPIHIVSLGIDPNYFHPQITARRLSPKYTFLSMFEWGERKAPEILLKSFCDEFGANEDVCLVCKINNFDLAVNLEIEIAKLNLRKNAAQVVILPNLILRGYEVPALYRAADAFVLPTRGEGWGMPILEAMACGLPVIATNWSAQTEFMNDENSLLLEVSGLTPAVAKCPYYKGFKWANPSYEHLRYLMRRLYEDRDAGLIIGKKAAHSARDFSWNSTAKRIKSLVFNKD